MTNSHVDLLERQQTADVIDSMKQSHRYVRPKRWSIARERHMDVCNTAKTEHKLYPNYRSALTAYISNLVLDRQVIINMMDADIQTGKIPDDPELNSLLEAFDRTISELERAKRRKLKSSDRKDVLGSVTFRLEPVIT